jgi:hypothetical protein
MSQIMRYCARLKLHMNHVVNISMAVKNYYTDIVMVRFLCDTENMIKQIDLTWYQHQYTTEQDCCCIYLSVLSLLTSVVFASFNILKQYSSTM